MTTDAPHTLALLDMPGFLASVYADLDRARERVFVETYIVRDDRLGSQLGDRLAAVAKRGVPVQMLYDPHGSIEAEPSYFRELVRNGVAVRPYRLMGAALRRISPVLRNHSRMIVIDGAAYTGGHAWADEWLPREQGGQGWHDLSIRLVGPVVEDFAALFGKRWQEANGIPADGYDTGERYPDLRMVSHGPRHDQLMRRILVDSFARAKDRIWLEHAYFFPTTRLLESLRAAAARGVDVRVLLPAASDLRILARAARAEYDEWIASGIKLWEYLPTVMHGKTALVDDGWAFVGTFNANPSSTHFTIELGVAITTPSFVATLAAQFEKDMLQSRPVDPVALARRPWMDRALDDLAYAAMCIGDRFIEP